MLVLLVPLADLYYGGEAFSVEQPQSFTCPYCGKMGYTETSLQEHVTSEHAETSTEVVSTSALLFLPLSPPSPPLPSSLPKLLGPLKNFNLLLDGQQFSPDLF